MISTIDMDCCPKPYLPIPMVCCKPYSTNERVYIHAQRLGLQSATSAPPSKRNHTLTPPRFHLQFTTQGETHTQGTRFAKKVLLLTV